VSVALTSPAAGAVAAAGTAVTLTAQPYLASGAVSRVEFYAGGVWLGEDTSAPYALTRSDLPQGAHGLMARVVTTGGQVASSAVVPLTIVPLNLTPTVTLTAPAADTFIGTGRDLALAATASDADGIAKVEFYRGSFLLHTDTTAPYGYTWANLPRGTYVVKAKAYDALGASTYTAPVTVVVKDVSAITLNPASPTAGTAAVVTLEGAAHCTAVTVNYGDGTIITHTMAGLPASFSHTWATAGAKTISATAIAQCEGTTTKNLTVLGPPSVSVTAPAGGASFSAPATVDLTATASAAQGTIASVAFYANGSLLHTDTAAPFAYQWTGVAAGAYALTAAATDTFGATAVSASVGITVGNPPPSTVTGISISPNPVVAGQPATITVTGTNPCGMIGIHLDDGETAWLVIPQLPKVYGYTWAAPGTYHVTAQGVGSCTGQASTTLTVTASAPAAPEVVVAATATGIGSVAPMGAPFQSTTPVASVSAFAPTVHLWRGSRPVSAPVEGGYIASAPALEPDAGEFDAGERTGEPTGDDDAAPFAPSVTVLVDLNGTGAGTITGDVSCAGQQTSCPVVTTAGATLTFTAAPQAGMTFTGWTGACTGLSTTCAVTASHGLLVVANFRATFTAVTSYYHLDALGSVRAITDAAGAVVERHDFRPFGADTEPLPGAGTDARRFAGEERDGTGLDYFGARYFSMATARFTSVDPIVSPAALIDPQKWNRYAYARNNPLRFVDPTGMDDEDRDPVEIPIPPCSEICQEFDTWAEGAYRESMILHWESQAGAGGTLSATTVFALFGVQAAQDLLQLAALAFSEGNGSVEQYQAAISTVFNRLADTNVRQWLGPKDRNNPTIYKIVHAPNQYQGVGKNQQWFQALNPATPITGYLANAFIAAATLLQPGARATTDAVSFLWTAGPVTSSQVRALGAVEETARMASPQGSNSGTLYLYRHKGR